MSGVLFRKGNEKWQSPVDSGYADEAQLQAMIAEFPELLPGVSADSFVCSEFNTNSGPVDLVVINSKDGSLTLVECKLARNPEVRRKIVGQIIDYAASLSKLSFEEFHSRWLARGGADLTSVDTQNGPLSLGVTANIEGSRFTLLLAVDEINEPLKDMVVLVNKKTDETFRVALIELARHKIGETEVLIPQTFGYEALKPQVDAYDARASWTKDEYMSWLNINEPTSLSKFENLMRNLEAAGHKWGGTKAETPSGAICVKTSNGYRYPLVFHTFNSATVEVRFIDYKREKYADDLVSLFENVDAVNTENVRAKGYSAKPKIEVSKIDEVETTKALIELCARVAKS
jgi:hypothetical protein